MKRRSISIATLATAAAVVLSVWQASAALRRSLWPCQMDVAKASQQYLKAALKAHQACKKVNLRQPGACLAPDPAKLAAAERKLRTKIERRCTSLATTLIEAERPSGLGFPGVCQDPDGGSFSVADIEECMLQWHGQAASAIVEAAFGSAPGPHSRDTRKCQLRLAAAALKLASHKLRCLERCRQIIMTGKLLLNPGDCASEMATAQCISRAVLKFEAAVERKCSDTHISDLEICQPPATTVSEVEQCLEQEIQQLADSLSRVEHAARATCGDAVVDQPTEECDGADDTACPGQCGSPGGAFPCLCLDRPRMFVQYAAGADLDLGWSGIAHDEQVVPRGGYLSSLSHCNELAPNVCLAGPTCLASPQPCRDDSDCQQGDTCGATQARTLPHCADNPKEACNICQGGDRSGQLCTTGADCPSGTCLTCSSGTKCIFTFDGFPLPLVGGGTSTCTVKTFAADVSGTINLVTLESRERLRETYEIFLSDAPALPCPVCGGFCLSGEEATSVCQADSDCGPGGTCVLSNVCSGGARKGEPCNPALPRGAPVAAFGNTSLDCLPNPSQKISGSGIDLLYDSLVTGTVIAPASTTCASFKVCAGSLAQCAASSDCPSGQSCKSICSGSLELCTADSDCAGLETCAPRCGGSGKECQNDQQCPAGQVCAAPVRCHLSAAQDPFGTGQARPNACLPACVGGLNAGTPCTTGSDCDSGECQPAVCILDPSDPNNPGPKQCSVSGAPCLSQSDCPPPETCLAMQPTEGTCAAGPLRLECSVHRIKECATDADCRPPACPVCAADETCVGRNQQCFTNPIARRGMASPGTGIVRKVAVFQVTSPQGVPARVTDLAGPGAIAQPASISFTGVP